MPLIDSLLRRYGNAGAVANARVELELARRRSAQVDHLADRLALDLHPLPAVARPLPAVAA
jgi:hypothetical protein